MANPIKVYLKYAAEFDKDQPILALCCRSHYVGKQIETKQRKREFFTPEENKEIIDLLKYTMTTATKLGVSDTDRKSYLEKFCNKIFLSLQGEDYSTEKHSMFYAIQFNTVANFIEVLKIFGPLSDLWEERRRLCKYKAAIIMKYMKSGKVPFKGKPVNSTCAQFGSVIL